jgi:hypothetical protein
MALKIFVARHKDEYLKTPGVVWVNFILLVATILSVLSTYFGIRKGIPVTGILFAAWLFLGGIFYVSNKHPYKTLHHSLRLPVALIALFALVTGIAFVKLGVAI